MKSCFILLIIFTLFSCYPTPHEQDDNLGSSDIDTNWIQLEKKLEEDLQKRRDTFTLIMQEKNYSFYCTDNCDGRMPNLTPEDIVNGSYKAFEIQKEYFPEKNVFKLHFSVVINCGAEMIGKIERKGTILILYLENISKIITDCNCKFKYSLTINNCDTKFSNVNIEIENPFISIE